MFKLWKSVSVSAVGTSLWVVSQQQTLCASTNDKKSASRFHKDDKIIHFVRHAEGYHNLAAINDPTHGYLRADLMDAELTKVGIAQCQKLHLNSKDSLNSVEAVFVSPMNRTIQTALHSFPQLINEVPWIATETLREQTGYHPCDKRNSISDYKNLYKHVTFDDIAHDEDPLYDRYIFREPDEEVVKRCGEFLTWLSSRPEREILVVTHSAYLGHLFGKLLATDSEEDKRQFANCELRSYVLRLAAPPKQV